MISRILSGILAFVLMFGTTHAFAAEKARDETTFITQATVLDAGGFPFKITAPGSYKLGSNLVVPANVSGILVRSNDVTLDLNGFSIVGAVICDNGGDACSPLPTQETNGVKAVDGTVNGQLQNVSGVSIKNGHVRGFTTGILTFGGIVEEITAEGNLQAGIFGFDAVVRRNEASRNHVDGIACNQCVVSDNVAAFNHGGNQFHLVFGGVFSGNTAVSNGGFGALIDVDVISANNNSCNSTRC